MPTGSVNGYFLAYLPKHDKPSQSAIIEQGDEMKTRIPIGKEYVLKV